MRFAVIALYAGCSFIAVHGPNESSATPVQCTESDLAPAIDSVLGVIGVGGALGGELADRLSAHPLAHYELEIGLPALVVGIVFLVAASSGTEKVEQCTAAKQQQGVLRGCDGCPSPVP